VSRIRLTGGAVGADSFEIGQAIQGVSNTGFSIYDVEATASRLVIDSSGNVGIGTTSPGYALDVVSTANSDRYVRFSNDGTSGGALAIGTLYNVGGANVGSIRATGSTWTYGNQGPNRLSIVSAGSNGVELRTAAAPIVFSNGNANAEFSTERARIDSSGRLLVGTSTDINSQQIQSASTGGNNFGASRFTNGSGGCDIFLTKSRGATVGTHTVVQSGDDLGNLYFRGSDGSSYVSAARISVAVDGTPGANDMPGRIVLATTADGASSPTERMRIDRNGLVDIGGYGNAGLSVTTPVGTPLLLNRTGNDGELVRFKQDGTVEGNITVSGTTVSYNGAHLARWSQLASGAERTEILRGSVLSNLDEMCEWGEEDNEQLNRMKVSDVEGDPNVSGVFQSWDDDDDTYTNDFYCAMTGDFIIRIAEGVTVERGDLLMSAGDGTAKPQDDDIIRSKTIAKVTSTNVSCTYADGSYCVPCVLMAC
jgi:hypothetical protein